MYLTLKQAMAKLDCDYQQILLMVANNKLQPFYINEAVVSDAKVKALLIMAMSPLSVELYTPRAYKLI